MQIGLRHLIVGLVIMVPVIGSAFVLGTKWNDRPAKTAAVGAAFESATTTEDIESHKEEREELFAVTKVIDGDTITIAMRGKQETIRLIGIDTPETSDPRTGVQCFGKEASAKAKSLLDGKRVRLEIDKTEGERDKYDRLLAYVFREDGLFINEHLIEEGFAFEYTYDDPYEHQKEFKAAEKSAKTAKKGLWAPDACPKGKVQGSSTSVKKPATPTPAPTPAQSEPTPATSSPEQKSEVAVTKKEEQTPPKPAPKPEPEPERAQSNSYECSTNTYNCTDFTTQSEAQSVFDMCGGVGSDVHKLDSNKDGEACESLP